MKTKTFGLFTDCCISGIKVIEFFNKILSPPREEGGPHSLAWVSGAEVTWTFPGRESRVQDPSKGFTKTPAVHDCGDRCHGNFPVVSRGGGMDPYMLPYIDPYGWLSKLWSLFGSLF